MSFVSEAESIVGGSCRVKDSRVNDASDGIQDGMVENGRGVTRETDQEGVKGFVPIPGVQVNTHSQRCKSRTKLRCLLGECSIRTHK